MEEGKGKASNAKGARSDPASADGIGRRLAELRSDRNLKVSELARLVDVTPSLISQIERGQSRPSVSTLFSLSRTLDVPVDAFFTDDDLDAFRPLSERQSPRAEALPRSQLQPQSVDDERAWVSSNSSPHRYVVRQEERAKIDIRGGLRWERLTPTSLDWIDFLELVYAPGAESDSELYRHPGLEMVVVVEGRLHISVGFDRYELERGDSISFPSSVPHRYVNPGETVARAITVILKDGV